ncbi:hypothetical protein, partial [Salmonella sp. s51090]|uniref:hypothetical protein n=1 Tax=Salmonella sp. s51090 TaxID=3159651 RepID=UPI0039815A52
KYALNDRDPTNPNYSGQMIDWSSWEFYVPNFACRCAEKAATLRTNGYFGLQFYGECWIAKYGEDIYNRDGNSTECVNNCNYGPCTAYDKYCFGKNFANFVYKLNP